MKTPKVSVLMPVFNGEKYLKDAIESILNQSFSDFEFIIINDGSHDNSAAIIKSYSDKRIVFIENESNLGLIKTLNKGLDLAKGEYIARMDCDDRSVPNRIKEQVAFMESNKDVGACGSFYNIFVNNKKALADFPYDSEEIKCYLLFNSPIPHPTVMIRSSVLKDNHVVYSSDYIHAEDYFLWSEIAKKSKLANVPKALLDYRLHPNQITSTEAFSSDKKNSLKKIRSMHLTQFGVNFSDEELSIHNALSNGEKPVNEKELAKAEEWLIKLINFNTSNKKYADRFLNKIVMERWIRYCVSFLGTKKGVLFARKSKLYTLCNLALKDKTALFCNFYKAWKRKQIKS